MAGLYGKQLEALCEELNDQDRRTEASEFIRSLVERVVLRPVGERGQETRAIRPRRGQN